MYYAYRILSTPYYVILNIITLYYYYYTFRFQIASSTNIIIIILPCPRRNASTTIIIVRYSQFTFYKINTMIILRHRHGRKTAAGCFSLAQEVGGIREFSEIWAAFCLHASGRWPRPPRTCKFVIQTVVAGGGTLLIKQQSFRYDVPSKENNINNNIVMTTVKIF